MSESGLTKLDRVFVSYCQADRAWLERFQIHIQPLVRKGIVELWDDTRIQAGQDSLHETTAALARARVAVLLVSADLLASDFVAHNQLPRILERAQHDDLLILPIVVGACLLSAHGELSRLRCVNPPERPLSGMPMAEAEGVIVAAVRIIEHFLRDSSDEEKLSPIAGESAVGPEAPACSLQISDVQVAPNRASPGCMLDFRVWNSGDKHVLINSVILTALDVRRRQSQCYLDFTGKYDLDITPLSKAGDVVQCNVSQLVQPGGVDRFGVRLLYTGEPCSWKLRPLLATNLGRVEGPVVEVALPSDAASIADGQARASQPPPVVVTDPKAYLDADGARESKPRPDPAAIWLKLQSREVVGPRRIWNLVVLGLALGLFVLIASYLAYLRLSTRAARPGVGAVAGACCALPCAAQPHAGRTSGALPRVTHEHS
jgi:hypothetical protein